MFKFQLGQTVAMRGVHERMKADLSFCNFVQASMSKYVNCDWGDTCEEDKESNDYAVENGERILAVYNYNGPEDRIWIITEWDRSVTTILFPHEY